MLLVIMEQAVFVIGVIMNMVCIQLLMVLPHVKSVRIMEADRIRLWRQQQQLVLRERVRLCVSLEWSKFM